MHSVDPSRLANRVIGGGAILIALAFAAWVAGTVTVIDLFGVIFLIFVLLWVSMPYLALGGAVLALSSNWISRAVLAMAVVASALFGIWAFGFIDKDAQGGLVLLFAPVYQMGGVLLVVGFVVALELIKRRSNR
jgi:hypothetical protein